MQITVGDNSDSYDTLCHPLSKENFSLGNGNDEMLALFALGNLSNNTKANLEQFLITFPNKKKRREILLQCCIMKSILENHKVGKKKAKKKKRIKYKNTSTLSTNESTLSMFLAELKNIDIKSYLPLIKNILIFFTFLLLVIFLGYFATTVAKNNFNTLKGKIVSTPINSSKEIAELNSLSTYFTKKINTPIDKKIIKVNKEKSSITFAKVITPIKVVIIFIGLFFLILIIYFSRKIYLKYRKPYLDKILEQELKTAQKIANKVDDNLFAQNYINSQIENLKDKKKKKKNSKKSSNYNNIQWEEKLLFENDSFDDETLPYSSLDTTSEEKINLTKNDDITDEYVEEEDDDNDDDENYSEEDLDLIAEQYLNDSFNFNEEDDDNNNSNSKNDDDKTNDNNEEEDDDNLLFK